MLDHRERESGANWSNLALPLFAVSVTSLFLELAMIRWISTEIRIFAYLQNSVLVACLLGLGMGCFGSRTNIDIRMVLLPVVALVVLLSIPSVGQILGDVGATVATMSGFHVWGSLSVDLGFTKAIIVFAAAVPRSP